MRFQVKKEDFINCCEYEKGLATNTLKSYNYELNAYQNYLEDKLGIIDVEDIKKNILKVI